MVDPYTANEKRCTIVPIHFFGKLGQVASAKLPDFSFGVARMAVKYSSVAIPISSPSLREHNGPPAPLLESGNQRVGAAGVKE
jgi:hypothetical protein